MNTPKMTRPAGAALRVRRTKGGEAADFFRSTLELLDLLEESAIAFARLLRGKASFRRSDLGLLLQECGTQVVVADIVAIAMVRIMGGIMSKSYRLTDRLEEKPYGL